MGNGGRKENVVDGIAREIVLVVIVVNGFIARINLSWL